MDNLFQAIIGTPFWVWGIFIYILLVGFKAAHTQVISLPRLFIIPIILVGTKYQLFLSGNSFNIIIYLLFITIGFGIGVLIGYKTPIKIKEDLKSIELPGSYSKLIILLVFFFVKYSFGYMEAVNSELAIKYLFFEISLSGLISGYFLGMSSCYMYRFYKEK